MNAVLDLHGVLLPCILFALVSSPFAYKTVNMVVGKVLKVSESNGCPTMEGLIVHTIVFGLLLHFSQNILLL